jgi:uncharacterized protein
MRSLAAAVVLITLTAFPQAQEPATPAPSIVASGEAVVRRMPDVGYLTLGVESRARNSRDAQRQNAEAMSSVQRQLTAAGIPMDAQRTISLWLEQEFDNVNGRRVARDFVARNTLEARIDDVLRMGEIADAVVQVGATTLNGIRFELKDRAAAEREALRLAVGDARARSEAIAAGAGRAVDRILKIEESRQDVVLPRQTFMRAADAAVSTPIEPGQIEVRAHVTLTVSMK